MSLRPKPTRREQIASFNAATKFYAGASERPDAAQQLKDALIPALPPKRHRVKRPVDGKPIVPLEAEVVRAVAELLAVHPKCLFAVRANSGAASYEHSSGKFAPVYFYRVITGQPITITDFWGLLRPEGDQPARMFAIECKREGFREPRNERELRQWAFITLVVNCGGVGGFVTGVEQAKAILDG